MSLSPPTPEALSTAAEAIRRGKLVGMPTETVYGIACDASDALAVRRVFEVKGRPSTNPLIVHIDAYEKIGQIAARWPDEAELLAERFWPGPLTLVLPALDSVPTETRGGLPTVAIRVPNHPIALALIREADTPVAAPSANLYTQLSPTTPQAIEARVAEELELILDGGPCPVGVESTVLDLSDGAPRILRPGGVSRARIEAALQRPLGEAPPEAMRRSPGHAPRHYAPRCQVELVEEMPEGGAGLTFGEPSSPHQVRMPSDAGAYQALLYSALHRLERAGLSQIYVELPPETADWEAVHDRLAKAAAPA